MKACTCGCALQYTRRSSGHIQRAAHGRRPADRDREDVRAVGELAALERAAQRRLADVDERASSLSPYGRAPHPRVERFMILALRCQWLSQTLMQWRLLLALRSLEVCSSQ